METRKLYVTLIGIRYAFEIFTRALFRFYVRLDIGPGEPLPRQPFLLCSNHSSHLDSAALMVASGLPFDAFRLLAAADYFDPSSNIGRLTHSALNIIAVDRTSGHGLGLRKTVAEFRALIRTHDSCFIAFPEGTRSTTNELLPFKRGPAFIAVALGVPVVPAYIEGAGRSWPKGRRMPRPGRIRVRFGRAIFPSEWTNTHEGRARSAFLTRELERRIADLARAKPTA